MPKSVGPFRFTAVTLNKVTSNEDRSLSFISIYRATPAQWSRNTLPAQQSIHDAESDNAFRSSTPDAAINSTHSATEHSPLTWEATDISEMYFADTIVPHISPKYGIDYIIRWYGYTATLYTADPLKTSQGTLSRAPGHVRTANVAQSVKIS